jgi:hypothetical protein
LLPLLERLFGIGPASLEVVLSECADLIGTVIESDKVDAFLYEAASESLVAVGTSHTAMAALQRRFGLNRLAIANGDPMANVYRTGECYLKRERIDLIWLPSYASRELARRPLRPLGAASPHGYLLSLHKKQQTQT